MSKMDWFEKKLDAQKTIAGVIGWVFLAIIFFGIWIAILPIICNWLWNASTLAVKTGWEFTYWQWWGVLLITGIVLRDKM